MSTNSRPPRKPGWTVYLLRCGDGSLYAGITTDLERRLAQHRSGKGAAYTRSHLPIALAWSEPADSESAAKRREAAIKRLNRKEKIALIETAES
jgi:putative endonuclease